MSRPTFAEIDLDAIAYNLKQIRGIVGPNVKICPAVKADGYGHGAPKVTRTLVDAGAEMISVATPEEAIELREAGIDTPILLLQCILPEQIPEIIEYDISTNVCDLQLSETLSDAAIKAGRRVKVHIKVDTGMGRVGIMQRETVDFALALSKMPGLEIEGVFTHFPSADEEDLSFTYRQIRDFADVCDYVEAAGVRVPLCHAANSAAILNVPESYFDMVRPGIMVYGHFDSAPRYSNVTLRPSMTLKTKIVYLKTLPKGSPVSYGRTYTTTGDTLVATVPIGYADGYNRLLSNKGSALVRGKRVLLIGRVCMDQMMLDVSSVPNASVGDEVVLYGRQGDEEISVEEVAGLVGTISYEVLCAVSKRVPRVYVHKGM
ncbi:MAG: alanine racemase [Armatimonadota bacterium]